MEEGGIRREKEGEGGRRRRRREENEGGLVDCMFLVHELGVEMVCVGWVCRLDDLIVHELGVEMVCVGWVGGLDDKIMSWGGRWFASDGSADWMI